MDAIIGSTSRPYASLDYHEAYARIAAAGYADLAIFRNKGQVPVRADSTRDEVKAVKKAVADAGLKPSMLIGRTQLDEGLEKATEAYKRLIDNAAELGVQWLLDCGTGKQEHFDAYYELMRRAAPHAEDAGLHITLKPHGGITLTPEDMLAADRQVSHAAFGLCFDPGNIIFYTQGERRPEPDVERVAPRVNTAIIKDCIVENGKSDVSVTAGDGLVDFPVVLGKLGASGFAGPYYVECVGSTEPEAVDRDLAFTLGYVRGILETLQTGNEA